MFAQYFKPCFLQEHSSTSIKVHKEVGLLQWDVYCYLLVLDTKKEYRKITSVFVVNHRDVIYRAFRNVLRDYKHL